MRRDAQGVVLLVVGAALWKVCVSGSYVRYVRPGMAPLLVVTALVLMLLGAVALRRAMAGLRVPADRLPTDASGAGPAMEAGPDGGDEPVRRAGWVLLAAAVVALLVVPPAAGGYQAARVSVVVVPAAGPTALPSGDPVRLSLRDYVGRAVAGGVGLRGRTVTLSGFVVLAADGRPYLARMAITCCAADARPIEVGLTGDLPEHLVADAWLEVDGEYVDLRDRDPVSRAIIPYVRVTAVRAVAPPGNVYE